jgi:hypothetical protein
MKKIFSLAVILLIGGAAVFAYGDDVHPRLKAALEKNFSGAQQVTWHGTIGKDLHHVSFTVNKVRINAYFNKEGELIASGRFVAIENLPLLVSDKLSRYYSKYTLRNAVEYIKDDETSYIIEMENEKAKLIVHAYSSGSSYVFKKEKKKISSDL